MKHLLIILISFLLLSSLLTSCEEKEQVNVILSSAFSFNPIRDDSKRFGFGRIFKEMFNLHILGEEFEDFTPYRQVYLEINGWTENEKISPRRSFPLAGGATSKGVNVV